MDYSHHSASAIVPILLHNCKVNELFLCRVQKPKKKLEVTMSSAELQSAREYEAPIPPPVSKNLHNPLYTGVKPSESPSQEVYKKFDNPMYETGVAQPQNSQAYKKFDNPMYDTTDTAQPSMEMVEYSDPRQLS